MDIYIEAETKEALANALTEIEGDRLVVKYPDHRVQMGKAAIAEVKPVLDEKGEVLQEKQEAEPAKGDPNKFYALVRADEEAIAKVLEAKGVVECEATLGADIVGGYM